MKILLAMALTLAATAPAFSAEPIEGTWKRSNGTLIKYATVGADKFCGTVLNNEYKGQSIGCMSGSGADYKGQVNKLDEGKTYHGAATVKGSKLVLKGCIQAFGINVACKGETLLRQ